MIPPVITILVAFVGYGSALFVGIGTAVALRNAYVAQVPTERRDEIITAFVGSALTGFVAVITHGLLGAL